MNEPGTGAGEKLRLRKLLMRAREKWPPLSALEKEAVLRVKLAGLKPAMPVSVLRIVQL